MLPHGSRKWIKEWAEGDTTKPNGKMSVHLSDGAYMSILISSNDRKTQINCSILTQVLFEIVDKARKEGSAILEDLPIILKGGE
jgi:hypothetical protein